MGILLQEGAITRAHVKVKGLSELVNTASEYAEKAYHRNPTYHSLSSILEDVVKAQNTTDLFRLELADVKAIVDPGKLNEAFALLIQNAMMYGTPPAKDVQCVHVRLALGPEPPWGTITIADNGKGMTPRDLDRLNRELGLSTKDDRTFGGCLLAKLYIETEGGTIRWSNSNPTGTTVTILLPVDYPMEATS